MLWHKRENIKIIFPLSSIWEKNIKRSLLFILHFNTDLKDRYQKFCIKNRCKNSSERNCDDWCSECLWHKSGSPESSKETDSSTGCVLYLLIIACQGHGYQRQIHRHSEIYCRKTSLKSSDWDLKNKLKHWKFDFHLKFVR